MREIDIIAEQVMDQCAVPVEYEEVVARLQPILRDFDVAEAELVEKLAHAFEQEYVSEGGVIVEWEGERGCLAEDDGPVEFGY